MTRSRLVILSAALLVAVLATACGKASNATKATARSSHEVTITVDEKQTSLKPAGNTLTLTNDLVEKGQKIGTNQVGCFLTGPGPLAECFAASLLPKGQILSQASIAVPPPAGTTVTAIVGGTGDYGTARGTIDSARTSDSGDTRVTFHIVLG